MAITNLSCGQRLKLTDIIPNNSEFQLGIACNGSGLAIDFSCFGLDVNGKLSDDRYMIFFNQSSTPCGGVSLNTPVGDNAGFTIALQKLPDAISRLIVTAAIDGNGTMSQLTSSDIRFLVRGNEVARFTFTGSDFSEERALMLIEIYRKDDSWRISATGQGFNGGLDALVKHFGGTIADSAPMPTSPSLQEETKLSLRKISLEKRIKKEAPQLINLVKKAAISLEKVGLQEHVAKVALCLDVSGSMSSLYSSGAIQKFAERILALGCHFDDDGSIDVFLFATEACNSGEMKIDNLDAKLIQKMVDRSSVGGGTAYGMAIKNIRSFYFSESGKRKTPLKKEIPIYVMFVTDGATSDESITKEQIEWSSYEPIFWQFMAIGRSKKDIKGSGILASLKRAITSDFSFLEQLDTMQGRYVDNANFFSVEDPQIITDDKLYELLMTEYPTWVRLAKNKGLLT